MANDNDNQARRIVEQLNRARAAVGLKPLSRSWVRRHVLERRKSKETRR